MGVVGAFVVFEVVLTFAIAGLVVYAARHLRGRLPRGVLPALILLLVVGEAAIFAVVLTHQKEFNRGAVPERP